MPAGTFIGSLQFHSLLNSQSVVKSETVSSQIVSFIKYQLGRDSKTIDLFGMYQATSMSLRNKLIDNWQRTSQLQISTKARTINYLSLEFLMGRALTNSLYNLEVGAIYKNALRDLGFKLEDLQAEESDAALGNGGLGRLAACFLDSMATLDIPAWGYGIRYNYGMFRQAIEAGGQVELPEYWLRHGPAPFPMVERLDREYTVRFYGYTASESDPADSSKRYYHWEGGELVKAVAYDCLCPGHHTTNVANLRLWSARPNTEFNLQDHASGDFYAAIRERAESENITFVLYPNDNTESGKLLRLKQEYFFVSASIQDILARAEEMGIAPADLHKYFAIQLNDTHPTLGIPELMRLLLDQYHMEWDQAWPVVRNCFSYTNHTVLPEALEKWSLPVIQKLLPRHTDIIFEINRRFLLEVAQRGGFEGDSVSRMSIFEEGYVKSIRMANLAVIGSCHVNGVAALHTEIIKGTLFSDFDRLWPDKIINVTNGVTPRRWVAQANPLLAHFISKHLAAGKYSSVDWEWLGNMDLLQHLYPALENDEAALQDLLGIKHHNKCRLAHYIERHVSPEYLGPDGKVPTTMLFDTQVKRIHEYKRQLMNVLQAIHFYLRLKACANDEERAALVGTGICKIFAGKAASAYDMAKRIIRLINAVSKVVNNDPETNQFLRVYFIPNYNVSSAEIIFPGTDLSEQISTAGAEASGTGNMKACMNGGVIIGTLDGANVEIQDHVGVDNIFIFGNQAADVVNIRAEFARGRSITLPESLVRTLDAIDAGVFGEAELFRPITDLIRAGTDYYLIAADFEDYCSCYQDEVLEVYRTPVEWARMSLANVSRMGYFSSDRSIRDYCEKIWKVKPLDFSGEEPSVRRQDGGYGTSVYNMFGGIETGGSRLATKSSQAID